MWHKKGKHGASATATNRVGGKRFGASSAILALVVASSGLLIAGASSASAAGNTKGDNGDIKVHNVGTSTDDQRNEPKVCGFYLDGFGFDGQQQTSYKIVQGTHGDTALSGSITLDETGHGYTSNLSLPDGMYKVVWNFDGEHGSAKHKVFKVDCGNTNPPPSTEVSPEQPAATTPNCDNPNETVTPSSQDGVIWSPEGSTTLKPGESVDYTASPAEGYTFPEGAMTAFDFKNTFDVSSCTPPPPPVDVCPNIPGNQSEIPPGMVKDDAGNCVVSTPTAQPANPTVTAQAEDSCVMYGDSSHIGGTVSNTKDDTGKATSYGAKLEDSNGLTVDSVTIDNVADGAQATFRFPLPHPAGDYTVVVTGLDGTTASTSVTLTQCQGTPSVSIFGSIGTIRCVGTPPNAVPHLTGEYGFNGSASVRFGIVLDDQSFTELTPLTSETGTSDTFDIPLPYGLTPGVHDAVLLSLMDGDSQPSVVTERTDLVFKGCNATPVVNPPTHKPPVVTPPVLHKPPVLFPPVHKPAVHGPKVVTDINAVAHARPGDATSAQTQSGISRSNVLAGGIALFLLAGACLMALRRQRSQG